MSILFRKFAIVCHRRMGAALRVFFLLWFTERRGLHIGRRNDVPEFSLRYGAGPA